MIKVAGIRFQKAGKIYYFDPSDFELETGMHVIVETARGVEMGTVLIPPKFVEDEQVIQPLKPVLRIATDEDEKIIEENRQKEKEAFAICKEKIIKHGLEMKLVNAEYTFDNNKLLFYFTADGRIDFRELVKDLAAVFRTRIELRQIGVRDETKILGGIGICGRPLCCKSYLSDFVPVSIKMAKEQNLSLNPTKISGVCGRLMCCLKNEQETYEYLNGRLPSVGDTVTGKDGAKGEVQSVSVLRQTVKVIVDVGDEKELREYKVDELNFRPKKRKDVKLTAEELKELEGLEDEGTISDKPEKVEKSERREQRSQGGHRSQSGSDENREQRQPRGREEKRERYEKRETVTEVDVEDVSEEMLQVYEDQENDKQQGSGENRERRNYHGKKRYYGKGKRYYGKNKKGRDNASEE